MLKFAPKMLQKIGGMISLMVDKRFHLVRRLPAPTGVYGFFLFLEMCAGSLC
jgi:hypothetical protein